MKKLVLASNMLNERHQLEGWFEFAHEITDGGILIVDGGSTDGTIEFAREHGAHVIVDDIIQREGYGPARNHLRDSAKAVFPDAHWLLYLDGDERLDPEDFFELRRIKDNLSPEYDMVAFPRIDWVDLNRSRAAKDWRVSPDFQARMSRLSSELKYVRRLHEQVVGASAIHAEMTNPKINHFHRSTTKEKRDYVGKVCAHLHMKDSEWGHTYPMHPKEEQYRNLLAKEGL